MTATDAPLEKLFTLIETDRAAAKDMIAARPDLARARLPDHRGVTGAGGTALHFAAYKGFDDIAGALVDAGADVNAADHAGMTPLIAAGLNGQAATTALLLRNDANANLPARDGQTPLMAAAGSGCTACVKALLAKGARADALDTHRRGTLHAMLWLQNEKPAHEIARLLLQAGADPEQRDKTGKTAVDDAVQMTFTIADILAEEIEKHAARQAESARQKAVANEIGKLESGTAEPLPAPRTAKFRRSPRR